MTRLAVHAKLKSEGIANVFQIARSSRPKPRTTIGKPDGRINTSTVRPSSIPLLFSLVFLKAPSDQTMVDIIQAQIT